MSSGYASEQIAVAGGSSAVLDLHSSSYEELSLARIYTRHQTQICLANGYNSDEDNSDDDEDDGRLQTKKEYHDNGNLKFYRTYVNMPAKGNLPACERLVEEKHFDVDGVCRVDFHFGLGQPYLSRKHYHANQRLKSEQLFFVEDERTMHSRKAGHWREYYPGGNIKSELQYNDKGVRWGFNKRYAEDGTVEWVKDYTKEYVERISEFNEKRGKVDFSVYEAAELLGFKQGELPKEAAEVNKEYRKRCAPLHPDKSPDPDAAEKFIEVSRAREVLLKHFGAAN
jgi:antitoxin component YwqK of YwqJK toxin-antitoxin module